MAEDQHTRAQSSDGRNTSDRHVVQTEDAVGSTPTAPAFPCYDKNCPNKVAKENRWCEDCQEKYYGHKVSGMTIKQVQQKLKRMAQDKPRRVPEPANRDLFELSFEELKTKEKKASEYLTANKHLQKEDPERWKSLMARYKRIVYFLNMKTPSG